MFKGWIAAIFTIIVWGVTFASTRALLENFSSLEILVLRFSLAWAALWMLLRLRACAFSDHARMRPLLRVPRLFPKIL